MTHPSPQRSPDSAAAPKSARPAPHSLPGREPNAPDRDWPGYYDAVEGRAPRDTLLRALDAFEREGLDEHRKSAADIGCGQGRDTLELLRRGWRVLAIDACRDGVDRLLAQVPAEQRPLVSARAETIEQCELSPITLLNVSFTLPFLEPDRFAATWEKLAGAIVPGGRFAGQFFGDRDGWASVPGRMHHTRSEVESLLLGFEFELFDEVEREGKDAFGNPKHWHVFHVVARRPDHPVR